MVTRKGTSRNLLPNAYAIAHLFNESGPGGPVSDALVQSIDELVSLYALNKLDAQTKKTLAELIESEPAGMEMLTGYQHMTRNLEIDRLGTLRQQSLYGRWLLEKTISYPTYFI